MSKTLEKLKKDPRVEKAWDEGEDGYWVTLRRGFKNAEYETHAVHEWSIKALLNQMRQVKPCTCQDCCPKAT